MLNPILVIRIRSRCIPDPISGCHVWQGGKRAQGRYGHVNVAGKDQSAHRAIWIAAHGPIPAGLHVLHQCDNGLCCNLDHLFLGTPRVNMQDKERKGRGLGRLSAHEVRRIREALQADAFANRSQLARDFRAHRRTIQRIAKGNAYAHVK